MKNYLEISPEVKKALDSKQPVVALESTIISHGMPYPQNMETALNCEKIIRDNGAIPATIAIINGKLKAGLTLSEIEYLSQNSDIVKTSRRDIPIILARKGSGATTVASTMIIAQMAGINVFATGGIGGVHRGAQETMDISADLQELAHSNVGVVCAGAKSILDLGLTLEYLETHGVPVIGYKTEDFPAFYSERSGFKVDWRLNSAKEIAEALYVKWKIGLNGGAVISNPIPRKNAMDYDVINQVIHDALEEAKAYNIRGKETTPFLLAKIKELTQGTSLEANIQLVYNNAKLAAKIAVEYAKLAAKS